MKVSALERGISFAIVGLLAFLGVAVWIQGRNFDPGLYSLRTEALNSTSAAPGGSASSPDLSPSRAPIQAPAESSEGYEESAPASASPALQPLDISGEKPTGPTEFYSTDTLYEKINGRAPAYQDFNFQQLRCRSFAVPGESASYIDVYEYRMDTPVNAFGIFALERDPNGAPLDFVPEGYTDGMGYFFRQADRYIQVIASDTKPATVALAKSLSARIAKSIEVNDTGLAARRKLPALGLVAGSLTYTKDNAQGQAFLQDVFQADYDFEGAKISFFIMIATPEAAAKAWESYREFSGRHGGKSETLPEIAGAKVFQATNFGKSKLIYQREGELGGVIDAQNPDLARAFLGKALDGSLR